MTIAIFLSGAAQTPDAVGDNAAVVTTVTYAESIEASGSIQAQSFARLAWKTGGTVGSVSVQVGDTVQAGDVLLSLDPNNASANIISAQADLQNAQNQLNALTNPDGKTRADAQKSLSSAFNAWDGACSELSKTLSTLETYGDSRKYADLIQASEDLTNTLATFALPASPDAQWYYWTARMESLARSGDYDFPALAAQLRSSLTSDQADLVDLMSQPGRIFSRSQLTEAIHGVSFESYDRAINSHINNLRRKLEPGEYIITIHGVGYKFAGE